LGMKSWNHLKSLKKLMLLFWEIPENRILWPGIIAKLNLERQVIGLDFPGHHDSSLPEESIVVFHTHIGNLNRNAMCFQIQGKLFPGFNGTVTFLPSIALFNNLLEV
jgi:hypothetical protein